MADFLGLQIHLFLPRWLSIKSTIEFPWTVWLTIEQLKCFQCSVVELVTDGEWGPVCVYHSPTHTGKQKQKPLSMLLRYWHWEYQYSQWLLRIIILYWLVILCYIHLNLNRNPSFSPQTSYDQLGHRLTTHNCRRTWKLWCCEPEPLQMENFAFRVHPAG